MEAILDFHQEGLIKLQNHIFHHIPHGWKYGYGEMEAANLDFWKMAQDKHLHSPNIIYLESDKNDINQAKTSLYISSTLCRIPYD